MRRIKLNLILFVLLNLFWTVVSCSNDDDSSSNKRLSFFGSCTITVPFSGCSAWHSNIEDFTISTCLGAITDTVCSGTQNANCTYKVPGRGTTRADIYNVAVDNLAVAQLDCEVEGGTFRRL